jgi:C_GCAxxG_C_C family probable redox protein
MIVRDGHKFNCCESVLLMVNEKHPLPGYDLATLRVASNLGGGVAGWGDMCGALIGGAMAVGLIYGTNGDESLQKFDDMRIAERKMTQELIREFKVRWRNVGCCSLLGCEGCTPEERAKRGEDLRVRGESHCDDYVEWVAEKTLNIIRKNVVK